MQEPNLNNLSEARDQVPEPIPGQQPTRKASRILFIKDVPRELDQATVEELFSKQPGYVTLRRLPYFSFVEFTDIESSTQTMQNLQGYRFRPMDRPLNIDYDKDTRDDLSKKRKIDYSESGGGGGSGGSQYYRDDYSRRERYSDYMYSSRAYPPYGSMPVSNYGATTSSSMTNQTVSGECSTLYVTNMPKDVTEREMALLFRFMPGFSRVRLVIRDTKLPICFADFIDPASASYALQTLQGFRVDLRDPEGLHIEFDKNHRPFKGKPV